MGYTTIQISKETRVKLSKLRKYSRQTYDEIINSLLDLVPDGDGEGKYKHSFRTSIIKGMSDVKKGRTRTLDDTIKDLGIG
ncbi:MAG: hypothetical protein ABIH83_05900 [Candidatus Micrarchaeota archaeon]